ncbi:unnamed protein product, partial [marine sediment metagenome]
ATTSGSCAGHTEEEWRARDMVPPPPEENHAYVSVYVPTDKRRDFLKWLKEHMDINEVDIHMEPIGFSKVADPFLGGSFFERWWPTRDEAFTSDKVFNLSIVSKKIHMPLKMARMMSDLSPEQQKKVANAYAVLKMADRGQMGGSLGLLGQLMGYAQQNPGASEDQMIKYLQLMDSQMVKGMEMMKAANPPKSQGDPVDYMVKGMELMKTANPPKSQGDPVDYMVKGMELMKGTNQ